MALSFKNCQFSINPKTNFDGLIFYLDPYNPKCYENTGTVYSSLINPAPQISAFGKFKCYTNSLSSEKKITIINLSRTNNEILSGIIGSNSLDKLDNYTLQFWFKNNDTDLNKTKSLLLSKPQKIYNGLSLSATYPYPDYNVYNSFCNMYAGIGANSKKIFDNGIYPTGGGIIIPPTCRVEWVDNQWKIRGAFNLVEYFNSSDDTEYPWEATTWVTAVSTFTLQNAIEIAGNNFKTGPVNGVYAPKAQIGMDAYFSYDNSGNIFSKDGNNIWYLNNCETPNCESFYQSSLSGLQPWLVSFTPLLTALSSNSDIVVFNGSENIPISGIYHRLYSYDFGPGETTYYRKWYFIDVSNSFNVSELYYIKSITNYVDYSNFNNVTWAFYIYPQAQATTLVLLLTANGGYDQPWEVDSWTPVGNFVSGNSSSAEKLITRDLLISPTSYSSTVEILPGYSSNFSGNGGFILSATSNALCFATSGDRFTNTGFTIDSSTWNCITIAQSGRRIDIYKNLSQTTILSSNIRYFPLSELYFNGKINIGQVLIYNRYLTSNIIKENFNNFKYRYGTPAS